MSNANGSRQGVYTITCVVSGHMYIGSARDMAHRWASHRRSLRQNKHHCIALQRAWNKHGEDSFVFTVVEEVPEENNLTIREQAWIDEQQPAYNTLPIACGSMRGRKLSGDALAHVRQANIARRGMKANLTPEQLAARSARLKGTIWGRNAPGRPLSESHLAAISKARKGKPLSEALKAKLRGKVRTEEHRAKLSAARKGKPWTQARRDAQQKRNAQ
ncbi:MAG TPA: GIY-YIG nuclease family protein [Ktedonobacterales bacterium]|nr:GIY-YIG nuclease family protein [Ktedonobacterales bacterium]